MNLDSFVSKSNVFADVAELQEFSDKHDESQGRQKKFSVDSSLLEQTVPPLKKSRKNKKKQKQKKHTKSASLSPLTNPCSPPAWWPPPLSCGCDDGIKCSAVSWWTQLNVAAVMSPVGFPSTGFAGATGVEGVAVGSLRFSIEVLQVPH